MYVHLGVHLYVRMCVCMYVCTHVRMYVCTHVRMYVCTYVCTYVRMYVRTRECKRTYVCTYVRMYVRTDGRACVGTYVRKPTCAYARTTLCGTHMSTYVRAQSTSKLFHIWHYYVPRCVFRPPYVRTVRTYPNGRWPLSPPQCTAFEALDGILADRLRITARHPG